MIFKKISKNLLDHRINILIQNDKIINRLDQNKDFFLIADNDINSSITDTLPMTQKSPWYLSTPSFLSHVTRAPLSSDIEVAKTFQDFFSSTVKNSNIGDKTHLSKNTPDSPV